MYKLVDLENYKILIIKKNKIVNQLNINEKIFDYNYSCNIIEKNNNFDYISECLVENKFTINYNSNYININFLGENKISFELDKVNFPSLEISLQSIKIAELENEIINLKKLIN
jgi:hypothetical protein